MPSFNVMHAALVVCVSAAMVSAKPCKVAEVFALKEDGETLDFTKAVFPKDCGFASFGGSGMGDEGAKAVVEALATSPQVKGVALGNAGLTTATAIAFMHFLATDPALTDLYLGNNLELGDIGTSILSRGLEVNSVLTRVDFSNTFMGNMGAKSLAKALKGNKVITTLWLKENKIGDEGAKALEDALTCCNSKITTILLDENPNISEAALASLAAVVKQDRTKTAVPDAVEQKKVSGEKEEL